MRMKALLLGDVGFQYKYGFYFLYAVFTVLYTCLLFALPETWRENAAVLLIFSDPAAMGLYFMGSIVLFERNERVLDSIAVSPVRPFEYMLSKLLSIAFISTAAALAIVFFSKTVPITFYFTAGVFLGSCLFSSIGLIVAAKSISLNDFILSTIPAELLVNIPAIAYLFGWKRGWLLLHPGVCMIELCQNGEHVLPAFVILIIWTLLIAVIANRVIAGMFRAIGGIKL